MAITPKDKKRLQDIDARLAEISGQSAQPDSITQPQTAATIPTKDQNRLTEIDARLEELNQSQQPVLQPASQPVQQPTQPDIITSETMTREQVAESKQREIQAISRQDQDLRVLKSKQFLEGNVDIKNMGVFDLLETANQANIIKDFGKRRKAINALKRLGVPRDFIDTFTRLDDKESFLSNIGAAEVGGFIGGGVAGFKSKGDPVASAKGTAVGTGIGTVLDEGFNRIFRPERAQTPLEFTGTAARKVATETFGDFVGGKVIGGAASKLAKTVRGAGAGLFEKSAIEGSQQISDELAAAGRRITQADIPEMFGRELPNIEAGLTLDQRNGSQLASKFVGFIESAFGGGRLKQKKFQVNPVALKKNVQETMDVFMDDIAKLSPTEIGNLADDAFGEAERGFRAVDSANFENLKSAFNEASGTARVSNKVNKTAAQKLKNLVDTGQILEGFDESKSFISRMANIADDTAIEEAITNNSNLNSLVRQLPQGSNARRLAIQMQKQQKKEILKAARKAGGVDLVNQTEATYAFSRESRKIYKTKMLELVAKDVADGTPHNAMTDIFAPDGVTRINNAKELLLGTTGKSPVDIQKGTAAWDELRWGWLRDQVDSSQSLDEIPLGSRLTKALKDMGDALPAMFSPEELAGINKMAKKMRLVERGATTGSGELIRFIQVGAAAGGRFGNKPGLAFAALGGPAVFARAMSKPNTHKLLLSNKIGQFITVMANTKLEMEKQRKAIQRLDVRDATRKIEQEFTGSGP